MGGSLSTGGNVPVGIIHPVQIIIPGGYPFQRVIDKGGGCTVPRNICQSTIGRIIGILFVIGSGTQLEILPGQTVFCIVKMLCGLNDGRIACASIPGSAVAVDQPSKAVIFVVYSLSGGLVKYLGEFSIGAIEILDILPITAGDVCDSVKIIVGVIDIISVAVSDGGKGLMIETGVQGRNLAPQRVS